MPVVKTVSPDTALRAPKEYPCHVCEHRSRNKESEFLGMVKGQSCASSSYNQSDSVLVSGSTASEREYTRNRITKGLAPPEEFQDASF